MASWFFRTSLDARNSAADLNLPNEAGRLAIQAGAIEAVPSIVRRRQVRKDIP